MSYTTPALAHVHPHFEEVDLDQNSDAWLDWRKSGLGSSDAPAVLGQSPWKTRYQLFQEKVLEYHGAKAPLSAAQFAAIRKAMARRESQNESAKNRGKKLEPVIRAEYEKIFGFSVPPACGTHAQYPFLKVSLDGLNRDLSLFTEIKAPNQKAHGDALDGRVPDYYVPQVLHQFVVSGCQSCHYLSGHDKYPPGQRLAVVEVDPTTAAKVLGIEAPLSGLVETVRVECVAFWEMVKTGTYIPLPGESAPDEVDG